MELLLALLSLFGALTGALGNARAADAAPQQAAVGATMAQTVIAAVEEPRIIIAAAPLAVQQLQLTAPGAKFALSAPAPLDTERLIE